MKKLKYIILSSILICFLLTACNSGSEVSQNEIEETVGASKLTGDTDIKNVESSENKSLQPATSTKNKFAEAENSDKTASWQEAYIEYLQNNSDTENTEGYVLIYVDNDEIPELVEIGKSEAKGCSIMNFSGNTVHMTQLNRLSFSYIERENLLCNSGGLMDNYYDLVYSIIDGELTLVGRGSYGAQDNTNVQVDEEGNFVYQYIWNDVEMSKEEYEKELGSIFDTAKSKSGYNWGEWYSSDEMLEILKSFID